MEEGLWQVEVRDPVQGNTRSLLARPGQDCCPYPLGPCQGRVEGKGVTQDGCLEKGQEASCAWVSSRQ